MSGKSKSTSETRSYKPGEERRKEIVSAAIKLLKSDGYSTISMRRIAAEVGISLAAVQHHFPAKAILIKSVVEESLSNFNQSLLDLATSSKNPTIALENMLRFVMDVNKQANTANVFYEIWALANREPVAKKALSKTYELMRDIYEARIAEINPTLSAENIRHRAALLIATGDGLMISVGHGGTMSSILSKNMEKDIIALQVDLVTA